MKRCLTCEGLLEDSKFTNGSPICRSCVARLSREYDVTYSPPERTTVRHGYVKLFYAIWDRAKEDGELDDWEAYWMEVEPWPYILSVLLGADVGHHEAHVDVGGLYG